MSCYIAVLHKDENSAFGVHFPDIPGCFSAADNLDRVISNAIEAIALYGEGATLDRPQKEHL